MSKQPTSTGNLAFSCECGEVRGEVIDAGPTNGDHLACHCIDCRDFVQYLDAEDRILTPLGGTALYNGPCANMRLSAGKEHLACLHLTDKPTLRWYAKCCRTPLFNTFATNRLPFFDLLTANAPQEQVCETLGPVNRHLFIHRATGDTTGMKPLSTSGLLRIVVPRMLKDILSGDRRRSELFNADTLQPIAEPYRLTEADRASLVRAR